MIFLDSNPDKYTNLEFHLTEHQKIETCGLHRDYPKIQMLIDLNCVFIES
jgi:hypothetical protein